MAEVRLINAIPLEKEMREYARYIGFETTNECESTAECCADMVSEEPTIDPENLRPVAHWDMEEDAVGDPIIWTCSNCKESIVMYDGTPMENGYKYCPMCGARMEDVTNEQAEIS